jgi:hypothetical protein
LQEEQQFSQEQGVAAAPALSDWDLFVFGYRPYELPAHFCHHLIKLRNEKQRLCHKTD